MRLIQLFPMRAGHNPEILRLGNPGRDYSAIRQATNNLLGDGHISDVLAANYDRLIVDEYQDCTIEQHQLICHAAEVFSTSVLGDPLQAIFDFGANRLPNWDDEVCSAFPLAAELNTPWRWINANAEELGEWLLDARQRLLSGETIDLESGPKGVRWVSLDGKNDRGKLVGAAYEEPPNKEGHVLIIGSSINSKSRHQIAGMVKGAVTVEAVDLRDLISFAKGFSLESDHSLRMIASFAQSLMSGFGASDFLRRVGTVAHGRERTPATDAEIAALKYLKSRSFDNVIDLLIEINKMGGVRVYRTAVFRACINALKMCSAPGGPSFFEAAQRVREQNRILGRPLPKRAIGSTLLLKGLEADVSVILNAEEHNPNNLYVAMTRGSRVLVICSASSILSP
jgi:DNA helicase-2/ATP-dependent DNA helicase PcrA